MFCTFVKDTEAETSTLHTIGKGFCGTVWAASERGYAFKREDGGPDRSLRNDFEMHNRIIQSLQKLADSDGSPKINLRIQIPDCYEFIRATDQKWWSTNQRRFPPGYTPCNIIQSERIPPFPEATRQVLINNYCPSEIASLIMASEPDKDCLIRPYLGRRRGQKLHTLSQFTGFSLRNLPLHLDQLESLGITPSDIQQYARTMAETLATMHWIGEIDGNDIEFVLAPRNKNKAGSLGLGMESTILGDHSMWVLDFDLCRTMAMNLERLKQAVAAFWGNDPYCPRPGKDPLLWMAFREHYIRTSEACTAICEPDEAEKRRILSRLFIDLVEQEGRNRMDQESRSTLI